MKCRCRHYPHRVTIQAPTLVPDGDGGYTETWATVALRQPAFVKPATARDLERVVANSVQSTATHIVDMRYRSGVTTKSRAIFHDRIADRTFSVTGVMDEDERHKDLTLACDEIVQ